MKKKKKVDMRNGINICTCYMCHKDMHVFKVG